MRLTLLILTALLSLSIGFIIGEEFGVRVTIPSKIKIQLTLPMGDNE